MKNKNTPILLVESSLTDVARIKSAFEALGMVNPVHVATTAQLALSLLKGEGMPFLQPQPKIILLDLHLPDMSGLEFIRKVRKDPNLQASSVFVMTTSSSQQQVVEAYDLNVAGYLLKPAQPQSFLPIIETLHSYWDLIELPA